ncbi:hypothetical protein [Enterococcus sp. DIV0240a]|uniref:hypothetical protein n=1 Tax=unclassified Enterococcus TaxID=2608891 RepID=UPI003D2DCC99
MEKEHDAIEITIKPRKTMWILYLKVWFRLLLSSKNLEEIIQDIIDKEGIERYFKILQ